MRDAAASKYVQRVGSELNPGLVTGFDRAAPRGVVCWYSVIHTSPSDLVEAFSEINRAFVGVRHARLSGVSCAPMLFCSTAR